MRVLLDSTLLASALYGPRRRHLEILFHSGQRYLYFQVPLHCYQQLLEADSKGEYFNHNIRNRFPFQRLSDLSQTVVLAHPSKTK